MNKTIVTLVSGLILGVSASAMAAPNNWEHRYDHRDRYEHRYDHRDQVRRVEFRRGDHLSNEFRHHRYEVADWRGARLQEPPRGHHWVRVRDHYALVDSQYRVHRWM